MKSQKTFLWKKQLPNMITATRIAFVPLVVFFLTYSSPEYDLCATILFIAASISDFFDGYLARLYKVESVLGQLMDPVADKLLVMSALIMMIPLDRVPALLVFLLLSRDVFIAGIRAAAASEKLIIAASSFGKWKTGFQMVALPALMLDRNILDIFHSRPLGLWLLWASMILSIISASQYIYLYFRKTKYT